MSKKTNNKKQVKNNNTSMEKNKTINSTPKSLSIISNIKENPYIYILSFAIPFIVTLVALAVSGFQPFGKRDIFTASSNADYLTNYFRLHDYIRGIFESSNIIERWSFYMTDPTNLIVLLF